MYGVSILRMLICIDDCASPFLCRCCSFLDAGILESREMCWRKISVAAGIELLELRLT